MAGARRCLALVHCEPAHSAPPPRRAGFRRYPVTAWFAHRQVSPLTLVRRMAVRRPRRPRRRQMVPALVRYEARRGNLGSFSIHDDFLFYLNFIVFVVSSYYYFVV